MNWKSVIAVLLNILAVVVPVAALYVKYGFDQPVGTSDNFGQLASLGGAMLAGFGIALISRVLPRGRVRGRGCSGTVSHALIVPDDERLDRK